MTPYDIFMTGGFFGYVTGLVVAFLAFRLTEEKT
jgi:hypothetical protein